MRELFYSNSIFYGISRKQLATWDLQVIEHCMGTDAVVFEEGVSDRGLCLVGSGSVSLTRKQPCGDCRRFKLLGQGDFFGEFGSVDGQPQPARATVVSATATIGEIEWSCLEPFLEASVEFQKRFSSCMTERLLFWSRQLMNEARDARRLASIGLHLAQTLHDLKTPLAGFLQTAYYLQHCGSSKLKRLGDATEESTRRMISLSQEVLDFSNGSGQLRLESVAIGTLLDGLDDAIRGVIASGAVEVTRTVDADDVLVLDSSKMLRVFVNVAVNAIEAMSGGGRLDIRVETTPENVVFEFRDTGSGIPVPLRDRIFEPFVTSGKKHGTGLGMAIARELVEAHGGQIWIRSSVNIGTSVFIRLPRQPTCTCSWIGTCCSDPERETQSTGEESTGGVVLVRDELTVAGENTEYHGRPM